MERHFNIVIWGKVQGVGFREGIKKKATEFRIRGYVKNLPNGTVFIEAEGEEEQLNKLINFVFKKLKSDFSCKTWYSTE